jgi:hypothetical protein
MEIEEVGMAAPQLVKLNPITFAIIVVFRGTRASPRHVATAEKHITAKVAMTGIGKVVTDAAAIV